MIAIVCPEFHGVHGIARYVDSFIKNLPAGHPPIYLLVGGDPSQAKNSIEGVEVVSLPLRKHRLSLVQWAWEARKVLKKLHRAGLIKVVNFHFPPLIPGLLLPAELPMVLTAHTTYLGMSGEFYQGRHFASPWSKKSLLVKKAMERFIFDRADAVITLTQQGAQEVAEYGYRGPIVEIANGVDLQRFTSDEGLEKTIDLIFVGRIEIRKGSRPMVTLVEKLVKIRPGIRICIVGYGDDDAFVRSRLGKFPNVELAGKVPFDQVKKYYARSKVYASTSYYEGLPGTCLEAMAMGLPVVVWDFLFYRNLVVPNATGQLAPPNDYETMSSRILELIDDPTSASQIGHRGRALLEDKYGWADLSIDVLNYISKAAKG